MKGQITDVKLDSRKMVLNFGDGQDTADTAQDIQPVFTQKSEIEDKKIVFEKIEAPVTQRPVTAHIDKTLSSTPLIQTSGKAE